MRSIWHKPVSSLAIVMFLSLFAALPLVLPGYIGTHAYGDSPFLFQRLFEIDRNVREGVWFSRWAPDFAYGYGYPFFNFYAHLSYYVAELFVLLGSGFIWALKLTQLLFLFGSGLTMYIFTRELWAKDFAALAAVAYVYTPFHFANVYLRGDSLSELAAYALYPAILWAFYRLVKTGNILYVAVGSAFYAALALTHNISSLIFSPVIVAFACFALVWDIWQRRGQRDYLHLARTAGLILLSVLLGLGLSAFFWIPALGERQFVYLEHVTQGYFDFHNHFLDFARLVQWHPIYDYRFADPGAAGLPFQLGLVQVLLAFAGLAAALTGRIPQTGPVQGRAALVDSPLYPWETDTMRATSDTPSHIRKSQRAYLYFFAALALATGFLLLPSSAFVWERVPLMSMIQFPWRLLSLVGIGTSLLAASTLGLAGDRRRLRVAVFWAVATLTIAASTVALTPERWDIGEEDINRARVMEYEYLTSSIGTTTTYEYLPKWAKERPWTSAYLLDYPDVRDLPPVSSKGGEIHSIESRVNLKRVRVRTDKEDEITFRTLYFPGWRATLDGRDVPLRPADPSGLISVNVPAGEYEVTVFLGQTDLQAGAGRVSTGALLLLLALVVIALVRRRSWSTGITLGKGGVPLWQVAVLVVVISPLLVLMAWNLDALILGKPKPPGLETLSADVHSPFAHRHSSGIVLGDALTFVGYTWSSPRAKVGETVTLETYWRPHRELSSDLRITARLVSPAESLFARDRTYAAQTSTPLLARPGDVAVIRHTFDVPLGTPPGIYQVALRVFNGDSKLSTTSPRGIATNRNILLGPFTLRKAEAGRATALPPLHGSKLNVGTSLRLLGYQLGDAGRWLGEGVGLIAYWQALRKMPQDYRVSVRLTDDAGHLWGQADNQPGDSFYPTTLWDENEIVADRYNVVPVLGTPPGSYNLELQVYSLEKMQSLEVLDENFSPTGTTVKLGRVHVPFLQVSEKPGVSSVLAGPRVKVGDYVELLGLGLSAEVARPGQRLGVTSLWRALDKLSADYDLRLELQDEAGGVWAQGSFRLGGGDYPTSKWAGDWPVRGQYDLVLRPDAPSFDGRLVATLSDPDKSTRSGSVAIARIPVKSRERIFVPPPITSPLVANLSPHVQFLGFELPSREIRPGGDIKLTLFWKATGRMDKSYTVFTHLLDPANRIWGQKDSIPGGGGLPTTGWLEGEIIVDTYVIPVKSDAPRGEYEIEIGMYDASTGQRLDVSNDKGEAQGDRILLGKVRVVDG